MFKDIIRRIVLALFAIISISAVAQEITVSGTVFDPEEGEPIISASVIVKGSKVGVVTDYDGHYSIKAPADGVLDRKSVV